MMTTPQTRYRSGMGAGWRGEGDQVPGNEPGGVNGSYGGFGQVPDQQPGEVAPASGGDRPQHGMDWRGGAFQTGKNIGQFANNLKSRYQANRGGSNETGNIGNATPQGTTAMGDDGDSPMMPTPPPVSGMQSMPMQPTSMSGMPDMPAPAQLDGGQPAPADTPTAPRVAETPPGSANPQMANGGIVSKPTNVMLGDKGPEAVIPLTNPGAKVTPGMFTKSRYRRPTGPSSVHGPLHPLEPLAPSKLFR